MKQTLILNGSAKKPVNVIAYPPPKNGSMVLAQILKHVIGGAMSQNPAEQIARKVAAADGQEYSWQRPKK